MNFFEGAVEKSNVGNRLKRILAKFEADRSHVHGVNGRSKLRKKFWNDSFHRCDWFCQIFVQIGAILAIFRPFEVFGVEFFRNFERPFTPRGWLRSARNFAKMRFRRFPTFDFSRSEKNFFMKFSEQKVSMKSRIARFGGATNFWASPSDSPWKMTPNRQKFKSLRSLANGLQDDSSFFFPLILDQNWLSVFARWITRWWSDHMMIWCFDDMMVSWFE